ncbi:hypothetical protein KXD40_003598 [Peronospora effusa]|nr:hypothetical protein KXD40_003598 [Peronospora effusa]
MSATDNDKNLLLVEKFARFSSNTFCADKFYKTIGYGVGAMGHLVMHMTQQETAISQGFQAIASNISMARYVIRFTGGFESAPKLLTVDAMNISRQSCRAWGVYILLDIYANALRIRALTTKEKQLMEQQDLMDEELSLILCVASIVEAFDSTRKHPSSITEKFALQPQAS